MYPARSDHRQQAIGHCGVARMALLALAMLAAHAAQAQAGASLSLSSELSVRGVSLSDGRATPQLSLSYDAAPGWYAGAVAAPRIRLAERSDATELIAYGGYAQRLASGMSWEAGISSTSFQHASDYNYREVYAGLASDRIVARLYLAPAYYGYAGRVAYAELNGFYPLRERLKLIVHAGLLHRWHEQPGGARQHLDLRLALGYDAGACNLQLAWLRGAGVGPGAAQGDKYAPRALALTASYSF